MMLMLITIAEPTYVKVLMVQIVITRYRLMMFFTINGIGINTMMKELGIYMLMPIQIDVKIAFDIISKMHFRLSAKL